MKALAAGAVAAVAGVVIAATGAGVGWLAATVAARLYTVPELVTWARPAIGLAVAGAAALYVIVHTERKRQ